MLRQQLVQQCPWGRAWVSSNSNPPRLSWLLPPPKSSAWGRGRRLFTLRPQNQYSFSTSSPSPPCEIPSPGSISWSKGEWDHFTLLIPHALGTFFFPLRNVSNAYIFRRQMQEGIHGFLSFCIFWLLENRKYSNMQKKNKSQYKNVSILWLFYHPVY